MQPYNVKTTKKSLIERMKQREEQKISPEIKQQVEEIGKRWERMGLDFSSTASVKEYPTQAESQAAKFLDFATTINDDKPRPKRWRNQS
jgi:hypothetical protein